VIGLAPALPSGGTVCGAVMKRVYLRDGALSMSSRWWMCPVCDRRGFGIFLPDEASPQGGLKPG